MRTFGNEITKKDANFNMKVAKTAEVGAYPANAWGLYDMHGNVWEWVEDIWHDSYQDAPADGSAWTEAEGRDIPRSRLIRGGSWYSVPRNLRAANRHKLGPGGRDDDVAFRVARTLD